jgi:hypothetical protein
LQDIAKDFCSDQLAMSHVEAETHFRSLFGGGQGSTRVGTTSRSRDAPGGRVTPTEMPLRKAEQRVMVDIHRSTIAL